MTTRQGSFAGKENIRKIDILQSFGYLVQPYTIDSMNVLRLDRYM